jgi:hypothetical protein
MKRLDILRYAIMEAVALIGGIPLLPEVKQVKNLAPPWVTTPSYQLVTAYHPLWDATGAIIAFLVVAVGVNLYFIQNQPIKKQVITTVILTGVLLATALAAREGF